MSSAWESSEKGEDEWEGSDVVSKSPSAMRKRLKPKQFRALMRKNATLQQRQWATNLCQILVPFILVALVGSVQVLFNYFITKEFTAGTQLMTEPTLVTYNNGQIDGVTLSSGNSTERWQYYYLWQTGFWTDELGNLTQEGYKQGLLGEITQFVNTTDTANVTYTPWYERIADEDTLMSMLYDDKDFYMQQGMVESQGLPRCLSCPEGANIFNSLDVDAATLNYEVLADLQMGYEPINLWHTMINMIDTALVRTVTGNSNFNIIAWQQPLPFIEQLPTFDIGSLLAAILYPFAVSFIMPVFVNSIVFEKQEKLREMQKMMGMKMTRYWAVMLGWDMFLYLVIAAILVGTSLAFRLRIITQTSYLIWFLVLVGWGMSQIALALFLSTFFNKARTASIVAYLLVVANVVCSYVLNDTVFSNDTAPYVIFLIYPPFACYRAIYLIGSGCVLFECPPISDLVPGSQMFWVVLMLFVDTVLFLVLGFYMDEVLPKEYGVARSPLFPIYAIVEFVKKQRTKSTAEEEKGLLMTSDSSSQMSHHDEEAAIGSLEENVDVKEERERIYNEKIPQDSPVVIVDLHKRYPGKQKKVAVKSLCLHIERGECFGLLGPNGAGKTTTISILTGLIPPTSGKARIAGLDISKDMDKIHTLMSVCPQFDILWPQLTCLETLLFYARLKGVPSSEEKSHALEVLSRVGLGQYAKRKSKELSGGMRRRLSIAVSLMGDPEVIFLDEPTTGLDPETKRHLWTVLLEVTANRSIIITTHSMEEADVLCSRIGIMSQGEMRCLGPQLYLKQQYGIGYTIHFNYEPNRFDDVEDLVHRLIPSAHLVENFVGNCTYQVTADELVISRLFESVEEEKDAAGVQDWGVSQTTLEDVFIRIVQQDEDELSMLG